MPAPATPDQALRLEVVVVPVSDVDQAKAFYAGRLGWRLDADVTAEDGLRVVQVTPPGSAASVIFGTKVTTSAPGTLDSLLLVVEDIDALHLDLVRRGVDVSDVFHDAHRVFHHPGTEARIPGPHPQRHSYGSFVSFADPDGNAWFAQEITVRAPGR
ncbi:MAG: VOC family protein [Promicromonosporaceae bacterium]|nr:VOC family protein [Promicromonosporaceae bacterium]